jgi:translation elongation factor EF-1beta
MTDSLLAALSLYPRQSDADISELKNYVKIVWSKSPATQEIHT